MTDKVDAVWEALKVAIIDKAPSDYPEAVMAVSRHRPLIEAAIRADVTQQLGDAYNRSYAAIRAESEATVAALRGLFARYIEYHGEPAEWDDDDGWCSKHMPTKAEVRAALATTPEADADLEHRVELLTADLEAERQHVAEARAAALDDARAAVVNMRHDHAYVDVLEAIDALRERA